jgi:DNA invertase Pin-like site-specific DNA recombinase
MHIIYTRTSSKTTFKKESPDRQIEIIKKNYPNLHPKAKILKEQCQANLSLMDRIFFNKIIQIAKTHKVILYIESFSRLGRCEGILNEFLDINKNLNNNITINLAIGTNAVFNPSPQFDEVRKYALDLVSKEPQYLRTSLDKAKQKALEQGKKFDGRKSLFE